MTTKNIHSKMIQLNEDVARTKLLTDFENELSDLFAKYSDKADDLGGTFRSPGIRHQLWQITQTILVHAFRQ